MIHRVKEMNRALLELDLGILFGGVACQAVGMWFAGSRGLYAAALWLGILLALLGNLAYVQDPGPGAGPGGRGIQSSGDRGLLRYGILCIVLGVIMLTDVLNPLVVFLGYMMMKVAAYLQPFTHKLCNMLFHETDPVPEPMPEEETEAEPAE